jgi:CRP-like cAMP-binding protein
MRDTNPIQIETHLSRTPLFADLPETRLQRVARASRMLPLGKRSALFNSGEACHGLSIVIYGQIKLAFAAMDGSEKVFDILQSGACFGETELLLGEPYRAHARALDDSLVLQVPRATVLDLIGDDGSFAHKLLNGMSKRIHDLLLDLEDFTLLSGTGRVVGFLLREAEAAEPGCETAVIRLPAAKGVVASKLNLSAEHFSRVLHELADRGLLSVSQRTLAIPSIKRLRNALV